jgi:hypothetical protein
MDSYFIGKMNLITFNTPCGTRRIDKGVYINALLNPPAHLNDAVEGNETIGHSIVPRLDGITYGESEVNICIRMIHHAAVEIPERKWVIKVCNLPSHLSVVDWVKPLVKSSGAYNNYISAIKHAVRESINTIRAILCDSDNVVGGAEKRLELLQSNGLNIIIPDFLTTMVMVHKERVASMPVYIPGSRFSAPPHQLTPTVVDTLNEYSEKDSMIVSSYVYDMLAKIIVYENPDYMKVSGFGPECAQILQTIMDDSELDVKNQNKYVSICDIYMHGIKCVHY